MQLKILRKKLNLTQEEMAKRLNIARTTYVSYENEINEPSITMLKKLAEIFNTSIDNLILGKKTNISNDAQELLSIFEQMSQTNKDRLIGYAKRTLEIEKEDKIKLFKKEN